MKNFICAFIFVLGVLSLNCYASDSNSCSCVGLNNFVYKWVHDLRCKYKFYWTFSMTADGLPENKDQSDYHFFVVSASLNNQLNRDPKYYSDFRSNLHVYNASLINGMHCQIFRRKEFPKSNDPTSEETQKRCFENIDYNWKVDEEIRSLFRRIYTGCRLIGHSNLMTFHDQGFLAFIEGNVEEAIECTQQYIDICQECGLEQNIPANQLILLGEACFELGHILQRLKIYPMLFVKIQRTEKHICIEHQHILKWVILRKHSETI